MKNELEWYAMYWSWNEKRLQYENVIREDLIKDVKKAIRENKSYDEIKDKVRLNLMYHFWSKCEWEMIVTDLALADEREEKIDVYFQLCPNLDRITEYLITNLAPRKKNKILKKNT